MPLQDTGTVSYHCWWTRCSGEIQNKKKARRQEENKNEVEEIELWRGCEYWRCVANWCMRAHSYLMKWRYEVMFLFFYVISRLGWNSCGAEVRRPCDTSTLFCFENTSCVKLFKYSLHLQFLLNKTSWTFLDCCVCNCGNQLCNCLSKCLQ